MNVSRFLVFAVCFLFGFSSAHAADVPGSKEPRLTLRPGLIVTFSLYDAMNSAGRKLGDYDFVNRVTNVAADGGYSYNWTMNGINPEAGTQTVYPEDRKSGIIIREFWPNGDNTMKGYVSYLTVSDATFGDLKAGKETPLQFDGPENPRSLKKVGEEDLSTLLNDQPFKVHTLKVQGAAGGTFWIVDDAAFPMVIKGETKWKWMATSFSDAGAVERAIVAGLSQTGKAATNAILFGYNSAAIDKESRPVLDGLAQYLQANPRRRLEIQGHTDNIGGQAFNATLSQKRAEAVKAYLAAAGVDDSRLVAKGYGLSQPVVDNGTPEGRARNRRVVFVVL